MRALIGHTGFVGSNLDRQGAFDARFNSRNVADLAGREYDEIWCAGIQAVKWWANQNAAEDWRRIEALLDALKSVQARRFVLFSTVDVFRSPLAVDEHTTPEHEGLHAYGLHRLRVEEWVKERFPQHLVVRLPGLFGEGLKKNVIYDMMSGNNIEAIQKEAVFQFYDLARLTVDVDVARSGGCDLVHFATEPVSVADVATSAFGITLPSRPCKSVPRYDVRTVYAGLWGREGHYLQDRDEMLRGIRAFVSAQRPRQPV
jgi:nucleoside-diphosphate-sugar epimerase